MKSTTKNMSVRIWFYFLILTGAVLLFLWMLQISFIGPYYERNKALTLQKKANEIELLLGSPYNSRLLEQANRILVPEQMCAAVYNDAGIMVYTEAGMQARCVLKDIPQKSFNVYQKMTLEAPTHDFKIRFTNGLDDQGIYFYGKHVNRNNQNYYIFLNTPVRLLDSTVYILKRQFGLLALVVFSFATLIAFILSRRLSDPITKITTSAKRLASGDLSVDFVGDDYTEIESLAHTLNYATEEFRKTDELRRDLVANVSHDIKTPLTMIKAYAEMIEDISGNDEALRSEHLRVIIDEVNHLENLVNDMLTLSRYESSSLEINKSNFFIKNQITTTLRLFVGLDLEFIVECDPTLKVCADELKMGQVLYNYVNNATKYAGEDNLVIIRAESTDDQVIVSVIDHGVGIPKDVQYVIWDRYYKIDKNYVRSGSSSGLGLSIVKAICDAHGSDYGVFSVEGKGSEFFYTLDRVTES